MLPGCVLQTFTFDNDLCRGLDHSQRGHRYTGVVCWLANVGELQHVASNRHLFFFGQLHFTLHPLDKRHWGADGDTCEVDTATGHHLMIGGGNGKAWWNSPDCWRRTRRSEPSKKYTGVAALLWHDSEMLRGIIFRQVDFCFYCCYFIIVMECLWKLIFLWCLL